MVTRTFTIADYKAVQMDHAALAEFDSVPVSGRAARMYTMRGEEEIGRMLQLIKDAGLKQQEASDDD